MAVQKIGRFEVLNELGTRGRDVDYLAHDSQLNRQVLIKLLRNSTHDSERLTHQASLVSKLQHPNIVALHDSGVHQGWPFLVYAHIKGLTLAQLLAQEKPLPLVRSAEIACGVLEALVYAHAQGVPHLDVNPGNILISGEGVAMLMDFGLAQASGASGIPRYRAPEVIAAKAADAWSDIYAVGAVLYEMVTGEFAVSGDDAIEVSNRAMQASISAPSSFNENIDEKLQGIILKAVAKNPEERHPSASAMQAALQEYLGKSKVAETANNGTNSTLEFLIRRMRSKSDFPALSNIISEINKIVSDESESSNKLARTILQDFALTNKLLKLVNTASYGQFGGTINTVSKAVVILGFETVRNIAMTLILLEFLKNKTQAVQLKDEVIQAIFAGIVAVKLTAGSEIRDAEEMMVCCMFHNLGRMLSIFYLFDEHQEVSRLMEQGMSEEHASKKVLGVSYSELGIGVARSWHFPPRLMAGMRKLGDEKVRPASSDLDAVTVTVNLAHQLCAVAASSTVANKNPSLVKLVKRYESAAKVSERALSNSLDAGLEELAGRSGMLGVGIANSPLIDKVRKWCGHAVSEKVPGRDEAVAGITSLDQAVGQQSKEQNGVALVQSPEAILGLGIQDVTSSLVSEFNLNDVLQMILEAIYRGMGFNRAIILIRDNKQNAMVAKFGFGEDVLEVIPRFRFPLTFMPDVFHLSIEKGLDVAMEDIHAPNIVDKIPDWYRSSINAPCFMLLPIMVKDKAIGLFYADMLQPNTLKVTQQQLSLLRTLRNQAVLAIKQKI